MRMRMLKFAPLVLLVFAFCCYLVMLLWNFVIPPVTGWHTITFWRAVGLLGLSRILFGGWFRGHGGWGHSRRRMFERWERMTPEERDRFRRGMRGGCGSFEPTESQVNV